MTEDIRRALEEARRLPGFLDRIAERIKEDAAILDALAAQDVADAAAADARDDEAESYGAWFIAGEGRPA